MRQRSCKYVMTQAIKRGITFYNFLGIMGILMVQMEFCDLNKTLMVTFVRKMGTFRYYPQPLKYKAIQGVKKLLGRS
ncbi:MAG: peptidoglycan bridge formation glycyltransferase FemA/FemB family protein [Streptococcus sp.]